jgi:hypothetical protein
MEKWMYSSTHSFSPLDGGDKVASRADSVLPKKALISFQQSNVFSDVGQG